MTPGSPDDGFTQGTGTASGERVMSNRTFAYLLSALALMFAVAVGAGIWLVDVYRNAGPQGSDLVGGPFRLTDHTGRTVTEADYGDRHVLVYFGYTYCPDICPTGLLTISDALDLLGEDSGRVKPLFITVDPERDTVDALAAHHTHFHPSFSFLTGTPEQIAGVAKAYRIYYQKTESDNAADYLMDHSTVTYLMAPGGGFLRHFGHGVTPEELAAGLREVL